MQCFLVQTGHALWHRYFLLYFSTSHLRPFSTLHGQIERHNQGTSLEDKAWHWDPGGSATRIPLQTEAVGPTDITTEHNSPVFALAECWCKSTWAYSSHPVSLKGVGVSAVGVLVAPPGAPLLEDEITTCCWLRTQHKVWPLRWRAVA